MIDTTPAVSHLLPCELTLTNSEDEIRADHGLMSPASVRREHVSAEVRPNTLRMRIPAALAAKLGVRAAQSTLLRCGDGSTRVCGLAHSIEIELMGRHTCVSAVIDPETSNVIVGRMVLDALDLVIDQQARALTPRYANGICVDV